MRPWQLTRASTPAGGIVASMKDQLRYARFHLGDGTSQQDVPLLSRQSLLAMQTPQGPVTCDFSPGLAWRILDDNGIRWVYHGGGTFGQVSAFNLVPERQFAWAIATNSLNGGLLAREVARDLIRQFLGNDEPEPSEIDLDRSLLLEYCGRYSAALGDLEISLKDGKLTMQPHPRGGFPTQDTPPPRIAPEPFRIGFIGSDVIAMIDPPMREIRGEFLRAADGSIAWLRWGARIHRRC
ncbi:MAG: serine hydrolase [Deltaproteobacteria bacterium]|nr:serine hydrolase [Deltaproteobacteria bacterium]